MTRSNVATKWMPTAVEVPSTGVSFAVCRMLSLGLSLRAVSERIGCSVSALVRAEHSLAPVTPERRGPWLRALRDAARAKLDELADAGLGGDQVERTHFYAVLAAIEQECAAEGARA